MRFANPIQLHERDYFLELDRASWPPPDFKLRLEAEEDADQEPDRPDTRESPAWKADRWYRKPEHTTVWGCFCRRLRKTSPTDGTKKTLSESVIRFPSAPLSGIQQKPDFQFRLEQRHQHTFRLLTAEEPEYPIARLFLLLNGLNEIDHFDFYYDLAELLITRQDIACIVYPYPGHLSRYPMLGRYAEKPLQRFIMDSSDLFRQYLRFMTEMQWLLSAIVPVSYYPVAPGLPLLAEAEQQPTEGRCDAALLSQAILDEWRNINAYSHQLVSGSTEDEELKTLRERGEKVTAGQIQHSIETIRNLLGWQASATRLVEITDPSKMPPPCIHIIGYSLGAYLAQSAFFTWPFAISSCTSLCAGAALHELRPVKIAHEEEWRAITHGLKYEIDSGLLERRIRLADAEDQRRQSICGIRPSFFSSHFQIFTDVFLQDPHGSYRPRVSEFVPRLLFVVGGNDPIVSTRSVLDASPVEGINMIEIANLSHFISLPNIEWSSFWLPTVARVISSLAIHSESLLGASVLFNLWNATTTGPAEGTDWSRDGGAPATSRARARPDSEALDSARMRQLIGELVDALKPREGADETLVPGYLFILRNQVPFTLMGERLLHRRGSAPHYEDSQIRRFWQELQERRKSMESQAKRITLVLPRRLTRWFSRQASILSAKSLPLVRELADSRRLDGIWRDFLARWESTEALYRFDPQPEPATRPDMSLERYLLERMVRDDTKTPPEHPVVNCLPDVWIGIAREAVTRVTGGAAEHAGVHSRFFRWTRDLYEQFSGRETEIGQEKRELMKWLENGEMKIVRISAAPANPRFLGERIWDPVVARDLLIHAALALARSDECSAQRGFERAIREVG